MCSSTAPNGRLPRSWDHPRPSANPFIRTGDDHQLMARFCCRPPDEQLIRVKAVPNYRPIFQFKLLVLAGIDGFLARICLLSSADLIIIKWSASLDID